MAGEGNVCLRHRDAHGAQDEGMIGVLLAQLPAATIGAMYTPYFIRAEWDAEAAVWVATSNDVPGLATEADTLEALAAKLRTLVPELLALNGEPASEEISWEVLARRFDSTHSAAAA